MSAYSGPEIANDGLVLCLDAANTKSYTGTGAVWNDLSGNGRNSTLVNSPVYSSDNLGLLVFDGVNNSASSPTITTSSEGITSSIIVRARAWGLASCPCANTQGIWDLSTGYWNMFSLMSNTSSGPFFAVYSSDITENRKSVNFGTTQLNTWMYLTCHYNNISKTLSSYRNGNLISTAVLQDGITVTAQFLFARYVRHCGNCAANIDISYFDFYNRALSAAEIQQNFNATRGRYGI